MTTAVDMIYSERRPSITVNVNALRSIAALAAVGVLGALAAFMPLAAFAIVFLLFAVLRGKYLFRDTFAFILAGNLALSYGFANIGLRGFLPIPFSDGVLIMLVIWCAIYSKGLQGMGAPLFFMAGVIALACARLAVDFYTYGNLAIRDFTTPVETLFLLVGYWAMRQYGLAWAWRLWLGVSICVVIYALFFPFIPEDGTGPWVGLQQPVHLIAANVGAAPAVVAAMFYFLLRFKSPYSWLLAALCLAEIAVMQLKGLYLGLPLVTLALALAGGKLQTGVPRKLGAALLFCIVMLTLFAPFMPRGRVGAVSLSFASTQISGLFSGSGDAGGQSVSDRREWQEKSWHEQSQSVGAMVWGMGLGKDLAEGFNAGGKASVRKPHNDYVEISARYGLLGLALWLGLFGSLIIPVWRGIQSDRLNKDERQFLLWVLGFSLTGLFIAGTQPMLSYPYGTISVFVPLGMGLALVRGKEATKGSNAVPEFAETRT